MQSGSFVGSIADDFWSQIAGDVIYNTGIACRLQTGEALEGWKWQKSGNCGTVSASARCAALIERHAQSAGLAPGRYAAPEAGPPVTVPRKK